MCWLALACRLDVRFDSEAGMVFNPPYCNIWDIGFSDNSHGTITVRPPRPDTVPYDEWCRERSLFIRADDTLRTLGRAEICEGFVYDNRYRADIDFTGIKVQISLRGDAYEDYVQYVGKVKSPGLTDWISWAGGIVFRLPSPRFVFPMPRGSTRPWHGERVVGKLKQIKSFNFDYIEIQQLGDSRNQRVALEMESHVEQAGLKPALCMGELSDPRQWWRKLLPYRTSQNS